MASTAGGSPSRAECASFPATFFTLLAADTCDTSSYFKKRNLPSAFHTKKTVM